MKLVVFGVSYSLEGHPARGEIRDNGLEVCDFEMADRLTDVWLTAAHPQLATVAGPKTDGVRRLL